MLPLIKIRATYLKRKKLSSFMFYLLLPLMILSGVTIYMIKKDPEPEIEFNGKQEFNYDIDYYLFYDSEKNNYTELKPFLENTSLVVENEKVGKALVEYIYNKTEILVQSYSGENELDKYPQNIIILDYNEKDNKYKFSYKEKEKEKDIMPNSTFPFKTLFLSSQNASNVFIYDYVDYRITEFNNELFFKYQSFLATFLIELHNKERTKDLHLNLGLNSFPPAIKNPKNYDNIEPLLGYFISMQFTFIFLCFSIQMLDEKDQKLEGLLERQGVSTLKYFFSWLINFFIVSLFTNIACILGSTQILSVFIGLFVIVIFLYNLSLFVLSYLIVTISTNKKSGLIIVCLLCFGSFAIGYVLTQGDTPLITQTVFNLFPTCNLFCSMRLIVKLQSIGIYSWDNIRLSYNRVNFLDTLIMFIVEIFVFVFLSYFIKAYKKSGLPFFSFMKSLFIKVNREIKINDQSMNIETDKTERNHEELSENNKSLKSQNLYLNINNVTRQYDELIAVNNFSGELFQNEIFCLLGHNGAGKTTLIKMISGSEDPDNGDIFLNNISLVTNKKYLFRNIGLCQQDDIFFDYLTVSEHLKYMAEIKGIKANIGHINHLIERIDLKEKKDAICKTLSGGEKRKLCIALALIGDSQLVLLDEPTSGMDVMAKRALWDFLKEFKQNKIIILTTHSLDEAEYLGDRIGIMNDGHFICSGTSSYLKSKYPCGFNLNLLLNPSISKEHHKRQLYNQLIQLEPNIEIKISSKGLFSINIQSNNKNIKEIFEVIENNREEYGIEDYTVSSTSLEDVFLKINHKIVINDETNENTEIIEMQEQNYINNNAASFFSQLKSHTKRGLFSLWRKKGFSCLELMMGLFVVYIYVIVYYSILGEITQSLLNLTELLEKNDIFICENNEGFFTSSYVYKDLSSVRLANVKNSVDKKAFIEDIYQNSLGNIGKGGICVTNINEKNEDYEIFNTEIPMSIPGYIMANTMLTVSSYLKKEYNINAAIFDKIVGITINDLGISPIQIYIMFTLCICTCVSLNMYLATIIGPTIKERVKNIKHILYLSGSNMWSYWFGFYNIDIIKMLVFSSLASLSLFLISDYAAYIWIDLIIVSFSSLFFVYCLSFFFEKEESGQKFLSYIIFFILIVVAIVIIIMVALKLDVDISFLLNKYNFTVFDFTPITSFILSSMRLTFSYIIFKFISNYTDKEEYTLPTFGTIYTPKIYIYTSLMISFINLVFYLCLLILLESGILKKFFNNLKVKCLIRESNITFSNEQMPEEFLSNNKVDNTPLLENDTGRINTVKSSTLNEISNNNLIDRNSTSNDYIQREINKINNDNENKLTTKIIGLKKTYWLCCHKNVRAINNLYLGLENNEKFGLLGFNGSGKTTTFKSITKEILFDSGDIILFGCNNKTQFNQIRQSIGYCPQENPLFDHMKVKEIIKFYLELKGVNESVQNICTKFGLDQYLETYCVNLSGGNKRKLSFALALMCKPKVLLLDEPSTGVDPESRRIMWKNTMELTKKTNRLNMILSTHSMEEAEVLCDTVSWLKSGNFLSIGNPEKLKITLSVGYQLHIKFIQLSQNENIINEEIDDEFLQEMSSNIKGLNTCYEFIKNNPLIKPCLNELVKVIESIKDKSSDLTLQAINKDFSFDFRIHVLKEKQSELFIQVLDMKNVNKKLSEISITMDSLENILTKL